MAQCGRERKVRWRADNERSGWQPLWDDRGLDDGRGTAATVRLRGGNSAAGSMRRPSQKGPGPSAVGARSGSCSAALRTVHDRAKARDIALPAVCKSDPLEFERSEYPGEASKERVNGGPAAEDSRNVTVVIHTCSSENGFVPVALAGLLIVGGPGVSGAYSLRDPMALCCGQIIRSRTRRPSCTSTTSMMGVAGSCRWRCCARAALEVTTSLP